MAQPGKARAWNFPSGGTGELVGNFPAGVQIPLSALTFYFIRIFNFLFNPDTWPV